MIELKDEINPREWQLKALQLWRRNFNGVVSVVTGGGKTLFAEMCIAEFYKRYPKGIVVIVVPTVSLLDQWFLSLQDSLRINIDDIASFSSQEMSRSLNLINIFVINSARNLDKRPFQEKDVFLIVDECHRAGSKENSKALLIPHVAALGISATPERQYDEGFISLVMPSLGPIIFTYDYQNAYKDNVICKFDLLNIKLSFLPHEQKQYDLLTRKIAIESEKLRKLGGPDDNLKKLMIYRANISNSAYMRIPVAIKIVDKYKNNRVLIFHERVKAANQIYQSLLDRNHSVTIYHSKIGPHIRRSNLRLYKQGIYDFIISCKALDEGVNIPDTNVAIIVSSTASIRQRIQRIGRVLRPSIGKDKAQIITLYVTESEEERLIKEASQLVDISDIFWYNARSEKNG